MSSVTRWSCLTALVLALALTAAAQAATPKRVVALTPFSANTLVDLGVKPIAIGETPNGRERFSRKLRHVRSLPLAHPNGPNMEQLATLKPGLVFSSPTWRRGDRIMRELDIKVAEAEPATAGDISAQVARIGRLVNRRKAARRVALRIERGVKAATAKIHGHPRVLVVLGVGRTPYVFLPNSWGGDLVRRAGGEVLSAGAKSKSGFARISDEAVLAADPEVIIGVPHARAEDLPSIRRNMQDNDIWKLTSAGQSNRIHVLSDDALLQPNTDVAATIERLRDKYLKNR